MSEKQDRIYLSKHSVDKTQNKMMFRPDSTPVKNTFKQNP